MSTRPNPVALTQDPDLLTVGIVHHCPEIGVYVREDKPGQWTVFKPRGVASYSDSTYDDLSLAMARCNYIARTMRKEATHVH